jgi:hypothetical protein
MITMSRAGSWEICVAFAGEGGVGGEVIRVAGAAEDEQGGGVVEDRGSTGVTPALPHVAHTVKIGLYSGSYGGERDVRRP